MAQQKTPSTAARTPRFLEEYRSRIAPALAKEFNQPNRLALPRLTKIVLNMGCGEAAHDAKVLEQAQRDLGVISGQKPAITRARKAISNFKIKEGDPVGCKVTLRRHRMYEFLERLICVALPRIRDFRGYSAHGIDQRGNLSFGITEHTIFPELPLEKVQHTLGMDVTIVTTAARREQALALLKGFRFPFAAGTE